MPTPITVIGKYQIIERLGEGGMGVVYLARDPALGRLLAVKMLRGGIDDALRERFSREARSVSRLRHQNIVTIFEYGDFNGQPFIAMEYISGESLAEVIKRRAALRLVRKLEIMEEVCAGMSYAHRAKIIHRDLKPANIMVAAEDGLIRILDFGIARSLEENTGGFTLAIGTPSYMSPEQATGEGVDHRTDIFAVGAVFYELLCYRRAFEGDGPIAVIDKIRREIPVPLDRLSPGVDPALIKIVNTALEKDPGRRYQDLDAMRAEIAAVREQLTRSVGGTTIVAPPPALTDVAQVAIGEAAVHEQLQRARSFLDSGALTDAENALAQALRLLPRDAATLTLQREVSQARQERERANERTAAAKLAIARARLSFADEAYELAARAASEALAHVPDLEEAREIKERAMTAIQARVREEQRARRSAEAVRAAERQFEAGDHHAAIVNLERFVDPPPRLLAALDHLRSRAQAIEARRRADDVRQRDAEVRQRQESARVEEPRRRETEPQASRQAIAALVVDAERLTAVNDLDGALAQIGRLERLDPRVSDLPRLRAAVLAKRAATEAAEGRRHEVEASLAAAAKHHDLGRLDAALAQIEKALAVESEHASARALRVRIQSAVADRRGQDELLQRARTVAAEAALLFDAGDAAGAIDSLQRFKPQHAIVTAALASLRARKDASDVAERQRVKARDRAVKRGRRQVARGDLGVAREMLNQAWELDPDSVEVLGLRRAIEEAERRPRPPRSVSGTSRAISWRVVLAILIAIGVLVGAMGFILRKGRQTSPPTQSSGDGIAAPVATVIIDALP